MSIHLIRFLSHSENTEDVPVDAYTALVTARLLLVRATYVFRLSILGHIQDISYSEKELSLPQIR